MNKRRTINRNLNYQCASLLAYLLFRIVKRDHQDHVASLHIQLVRVVGGIIVHHLNLWGK